MMARSRYYPTHDYQEIRVFRRVWANLGQLCSMSLATPVRENESKYTKHAYYASSNEAIHLPLISCPICATTATDDREAGSWGPFGKNASLLFYQPIDEIRDYFGDEVALYFAPSSTDNRPAQLTLSADTLN